jgi:signal transduction histidine kinase
MVAATPAQIEQSQTGFMRRLLALVVAGFVALIAIAIVTALVQARNQESGRLVQHTLEVQGRLGQFSSANERMETARRGVLLSPDATFRERMNAATVAAAETLEQIAALTRDNPVQQRHIAQLRKLIGEKREIQRRTLTLSAAAARREGMGSFLTDPGVMTTRHIRETANLMLDEERRLLAERDAEQARTTSIFNVIFVAAIVMLVLVAATTITVMLRYLRDLSASRHELRRLNEDLELIVDERTEDLRRANQEIQRFAYIVSHDLRSPLVNVMGFTAELDASAKTILAHFDRLSAEHPELADEPARLAVAEDLPEAIGFIRSSTQKMDRLINAILRLSREGRRTLTPERIDADALVHSIADTLQHRLNDVGAEVTAGPLPEVVTDRLALEQILSNLVENAVKYLQPGRPGIIRVTGRRERDRTVYEVTDNGRGIDPRDHERIFDLFRRSGTQDQPGEGIGLAHVRALAYRLGGVIEVRSELDRGSTFRLSLPSLLKAGDLQND